MKSGKSQKDLTGESPVECTTDYPGGPRAQDDPIPDDTWPSEGTGGTVSVSMYLWVFSPKIEQRQSPNGI